MSAPTATDRLARLLALVPWVAAHPDGVDEAEVLERFDLTESELIRDLDTVMMVGVHPFTPDTMIEAWVDEGRVQIHYADAFGRPLRLTAGEAVSLLTAVAGLGSVPGADRAGPLRRAEEKLAAVVGGDTGAGVEVDLGTAPPGVFDVLETARGRGTQVEIDYPDADGGTVGTRRIEPFQLFSSAGRWYVSGWCHRAGDQRVFRLDRIVAARPTDEPGVHPDDDVQHPEAVSFDASLPQVELMVDSSAAWLLDGVPVLERQDVAGGVRVRLAISSTRWLARLLLQAGDAARPVEADPALDLDRLVRDEASDILRLYR